MFHYDELRPQQGISRYFYIQRFCFARIGISISSLDRTITSPCQLWFLTFSLCTLALLILVYAIQNIDDLDEATYSLSPFWQMLIVISKIFYFKFNSKKIIVVIRRLWLWNLEAKGEEHKILASENRKDIVFCNFYHLAVASTGFLALLAPIIMASFYAWQGEKFSEYLEPPLKAAYVIDKKSIYGYIFVYIWNVIGVYFLIYGSVAIDSLFSWFMCNIVAHFRILKYRLRVAGDEDNGDCSVKTVRDCISYHCRTLKMAEDFKNVFRVIVFIKFAISCIQICFLAFQLSRGGKLIDQVYLGLFLMSVSMQLILYCYGGQRIQNESEAIADEIYLSFHWESLTVSNKKMLMFSMKRAQMCCDVSGIFFTANLKLYLWVYRTAASWITLLWTLEDDNEMN